MRTQTLFAMPALLATLATTLAGCGGSPESAPPASSKATAAKPPQGTLTADPNPVQVCDGSGLGVTTLSWKGPAGKIVEVRVGSPDGVLFAQTGSTGTKATGKWVSNNTVFYLQRVGAEGQPGETVATVRVAVTREGCK
ncbi:hypothetical protein FBQ97_11660 [Acidobacteria bacterium ACD]|nr:MAG: hypothetical protein EDX89_08635 [Acidobacteriota bacterium]MCE7959492.1 hypothetical protein [Acidobacteria bacterium ACB2]MDL1950453.1 hypothetical protein [Acidobacteria bacterium ACD]